MPYVLVWYYKYNWIKLPSHSPLLHYFFFYMKQLESRLLCYNRGLRTGRKKRHRKKEKEKETKLQNAIYP